MSTASRRTSRLSRGQAVTEFALILPLLLALVGAGVDFARAFEVSMILQTATRNAAEAAAYDAANLAEAEPMAREVVCAEAQRLPGFQPGGGGNVATCTDPSVIVTYVRDPSAPGANTRYPRVTVTVSTSLDFQLVVPWPFLPDGVLELGTTQSFSLMQGR